MLILKAFKPLVNSESMLLAVYLALGFLISQLTHIQCYYSRGATKLMTWYKLVGLTEREPSLVLIAQLCVIVAVLTFFAFQLFAHYASNWPSLTVLTRCILFCCCLCLASQALFSSAMRLAYEVLFSFVIVASMLIAKAFLQGAITGLTIESREYSELWDVLKFITPLCIGIPILMGGAGFITSFYQAEKDVIRLQLYRHIAMAIYFELGAVLFLIYPVLKRVLLIRGT